MRQSETQDDVSHCGGGAMLRVEEFCLMMLADEHRLRDKPFLLGTHASYDRVHSPRWLC